MGTDVSSAKLKPIATHKHHHVDKTDKTPKTDPPAAAKPKEAAHAGAKDEFTTGGTKVAKPLTEGDFGVSHAFGHPSAHGHISEADWADPAKLMSKLTQYPHGKKDTQSEAACGAANVLGAAMLSGGPDSAASVIKDAANNSGLTSKEQDELKAIGDRVSGHTATFEDLNKAQELMYRSIHSEVPVKDAADQAKRTGKLNHAEMKKLDKAVENGGPDSEINKLLTKAFGEPVELKNGYMEVSAKRRAKDTAGLSDGEMAKLTGIGSEQVGISKVDLVGQAKDLQPGQALTVRVAAKHSDPDPDHYVTIGRRKDGSYYIYNPDPGKGDATLSLGKNVDDPKFLDQIHKYELREKQDNGNGGFPATKYYPPG